MDFKVIYDHKVGKRWSSYISILQHKHAVEKTYSGERNRNMEHL